MEDRFKFRIWHNQDKKMYQVRTIMTSNNKHNYKISGYSVQDGRNILRFDVPEEFDACTLMQCTGLKDKNGTLIYEGDIVEYDRSDLFYGAEIIKGYIAVYKFEWAIMYYSPTIVNADTKKPSLQHLWLGNDDFLGSRTTILGNIHENSELLGWESEDNN